VTGATVQMVCRTPHCSL